MTSKRKAVDEISGHLRKSPAHLMPTKDPQSIWMERIESDPYSNDKYHEGTQQKSKAMGEAMPEIFSTARQDLTYSDYTVGWICALPETELVAACEMLDEEHPMLPAADGDTNVYFLGRIGSHNVVIACLPDGSTGKSSAATVAKDMLRSFRKVRFGVLVGVGGGAPYLGNSDNSKATAEGSDEEDEEFGDIKDIRLGDVVISLHSKSSEAVVQYDFGKSVQGGVFFRTGTLNKPPHILCAAVGKLKARHIAHGHKLSDHLSKISANLRLAPKFQYQGASKDQLFKANVVHSKGRKTCKDCCGALNVNLVERKERHDTSPALHYGTIGSADQVIKDSTLRNKWAKKENIICFEMEAAGLMDSFPCLVIRGICDYADSHKNKIWQPYAAATAAAYAKELLNVISGAEVTKMRTVNEAMEKLSADIAVNTAVSQRVEKHMLTADELSILDWLSSSNFSAPQNSASDSRTPGTGLLWLHGVVIEDLQQLYKRNPQKRLAYWYFQFSDVNTQNVCNMLQSFLRQLSSSPLSSAIRGLRDRHQKSGSRPSTEELMEAVRNIIKGTEQDVFIVIDALDECPLSERRNLLRRINELRNVNNMKVHILATSRREPDINNELKNLPAVAMNIEDQFGKDIKLFVEAALLKNVKLSRWDEDSKSQIREKLTAINETLEQTYEEALKRIPAKYEERVRNILMWLTSSRRPMTLQEIAVVASFDIAQGVLELCSSLLVTLIDENVNQTIKLAHFSVKEYLIITTQKQKLPSPYRFKNELAQAVISEMTVTYLLDSDKSVRLGKKVMPRSLLKYSAEFWPQHAIEAFNSNDPALHRDCKLRLTCCLVLIILRDILHGLISMTLIRISI
ncbi:hypothetical protein B0O99DRAFT_600681 [Bisporella sp. PMI_857]|nr:hypothetical protein B0O99DRAFT_600681 [Bisporella sp. PMI_857]